MRVEEGGTLYPGVDSPPNPPIDYVHRGRDRRNCFQHPLDQALLNPFDHYVKMKAYMRVEGWGEPLPRGRLSPPTFPID